MGSRESVVEQLRILRIAVGNERETREFYLRAVGQVRSPRGRAMYSSLAEEESVHERVIQSQIEALEDTGAWQDTASELGEMQPVAGAAADISARIREVEQGVRPGDTDLDAVSHALRLEMDSHTFYNKAASGTADPLGRAMYEQLAAMERAHFEALFLEYENLVRTGPTTDSSGGA